MVYRSTNCHSNRGMGLEKDINMTNTYYIEKDIAVIYKKPTPVKVTKVVNNYKVKDGFYEMPSTTDYNGVYKSKYIDFEAKEIKKMLSFPLKNIHKHQIDHLVKIKKHGGISFIIVRFCDKNITYLLDTNKLIDFIDKEDRKSIPISYFEDNAYKINESYIPRLDYLKVVNNMYFNKEVL